MNVKRFLPLLLVFAMLAGCSTSLGDVVSPSPSPSETVDPSPSASPTPAADDDGSLLFRTTGYPEGTDAYMLDGVAYPMEYYLYFLCNTLDMYSYYGYPLNFSEDVGGMTLGEYFKNDFLDAAVMYTKMYEEARRLNLPLEDVETEIVDYLAQVKESTGDYFPYWLKSMFVTEESFVEMETILYAQQVLHDYYYGENGIEAPAEEDYAALAEEQGWLGAKHILLLTQTADGTQFSAEEKAAVEQQAQDLRAQLAAAGDSQELFDQLMNEFSEDTGLPAYPDGYTFGPNKMVAEFENGTKALELYEVSEPIQSSYGYHIIMRIPIDDSDEELRSGVIESLWNVKLDEWIADAEPIPSEAWNTFDLASFNEKRNEALVEYDQYYTPAEEDPIDDPNDTTIDHTGHNHE